jgi:hypothetical protein
LSIEGKVEKLIEDLNILRNQCVYSFNELKSELARNRLSSSIEIQEIHKALKEMLEIVNVSVNTEFSQKTSQQKVTCYKYDRPFDAILYLADDGQVIHVHCPMLAHCQDKCDHLH